MSITVRFAAAVVSLMVAGHGVDAATLGLPIFTTTPSSVFVTNQFGGNVPTPSYTLNLNSTIATADGAPELVGQTIAFSWFFNGGFDDGTVTPSLVIGGISVLADPLDQADRVLISPSIASDVFDPVTNLSTFQYSGIFAGFGPRVAAFPDIILQFALNAPIPTKEGYFYCDPNDPSDCQFSNTPGLTEINGSPVVVGQSFLGYPEGTITNAVITFSTVDGRAVAPVPLPASGLLLMGAAGLLAAASRRNTR